MKIDSFDVNLSSSRTYTESHFQEITHEFAFVDLMDLKLGNQQETVREAEGVEPEISQVAGRGSQWYQPVMVGGRPAVNLSDQFLGELQKMRQVMDSIMDNFRNMMGQGCRCNLDQVNQVYAMPMGRGNRAHYVAWEYTQTQSYTYTESEQTRVQANGIVKTADNREIDFSMDMEMSRSFISETYFSKTQTGYALVDPLVVSTDVDTPMLFGGQFSFDLDLDPDNGLEEMSMPAPGFGFLSLDLNKDGKINDGSELFGPTTGDGFKELSAYDLDHNNWIDENDAIFDELTLWEQDHDNGMTLTRIKDAGIGAIYLASVASPFDLKNQENDLLARVGKTSIALSETGEVLPVQEVDWKV